MPGTQPAELRLMPFRAVRYANAGDELARVIAPPYDVIDEEQRRTLEARDPHNVVRLILPRSPDELTDRESPSTRNPAAGSSASRPSATGTTTDTATDKYAAAAATFDRWLSDGVLLVDDEPALYVYQQRRETTILQRGLFGAVVLQPLESGVILPHENVHPGPVEDRLSLMRAMRGNPEPIFLLYDGGGRATAISAETVARPPIAATRTNDGVTHELWAITNAADLAAIADDLAARHAMIADGHHRYTTYGYLRDELRAAGSGDGPWDSGLTLLVDNSVATPDIRAIHRVVPGLSFASACDRAAEAFRVDILGDAVTTAAEAVEELARHTGPAFLITDGDSFALLVDPSPERLAAAKPPDRTPAWWALDASIAGVLLMEQVWGVFDAAGHVEAEHDPEAAITMAKRIGGVALLLNPAPLAGIVAVAQAGDAMPRKSTLFMPKPQSGMVLRSFSL